MRLRLSETVNRRMADPDHGWWFPERRAEEPNYLVSLNQTSISSALTHQSFAVQRSLAGLILRCFVG
jgi:hypothetical protein